MDKNKIISIILLIFILSLALGIGLFFSYTSILEVNNKESFVAIRNTIDNQDKIDPVIISQQLQGLYLYMRILYKMSKEYTGTYQYHIYNFYNNLITNNLVGNINTKNIIDDTTTISTNMINLNDIKIQNIFNENNCDFYYTLKNNVITCNYNIKNGDDFKDFIKRLYYSLTEHSSSNLKNKTIAKEYYDYNYIYNDSFYEKLEIMYVHTFVPVALYNMYIIDYNSFIEIYKSDTVFRDEKQAYYDYIVFTQMYNSAKQMNIPLIDITDENGKILKYIDLKNNTNGYANKFMEKIYYIFDSMKITKVLEPSYILFYNCLLYFVKKYKIPPNINIVAQTRLPPPTLQPTTLKPTTLQPTTLQPTTLQPTILQPTTLQPTTLQPTTLQPTTLQPTTLQPTTLQPTTLKPTTLKPTADRNVEIAKRQPEANEKARQIAIRRANADAKNKANQQANDKLHELAFQDALKKAYEQLWNDTLTAANAEAKKRANAKAQDELNNIKNKLNALVKFVGRDVSYTVPAGKYIENATLDSNTQITYAYGSASIEPIIVNNGMGVYDKDYDPERESTAVKIDVLYNPETIYANESYTIIDGSGTSDVVTLYKVSATTTEQYRVTGSGSSDSMTTSKDISVYFYKIEMLYVVYYFYIDWYENINTFYIGVDMSDNIGFCSLKTSDIPGLGVSDGRFISSADMSAHNDTTNTQKSSYTVTDGKHKLVLLYATDNYGNNYQGRYSMYLNMVFDPDKFYTYPTKGENGFIRTEVYNRINDIKDEDTRKMYRTWYDSQNWKYAKANLLEKRFSINRVSIQDVYKSLTSDSDKTSLNDFIGTQIDKNVLDSLVKTQINITTDEIQNIMLNS